MCDLLCLINLVYFRQFEHAQPHHLGRPCHYGGAFPTKEVDAERVKKRKKIQASDR
jgi:hypothetical protein